MEPEDQAGRETHAGPDRPRAPGSVRSGSRATRQSPGYVRFERPTAWAAIARSRRPDAKGKGQISLTEQGSRVIVRTKLRPNGLLALLLPLMRRTTHEREDQNLYRVKAILEGTR